jgi:hypothetical protein
MARRGSWAPHNQAGADRKIGVDTTIPGNGAGFFDFDRTQPRPTV